MAKPSLFIGSSVESLAVANVLGQQLRYDANVNVWNQGIFGLSTYTLDALLSATKEFDFAAFVFGADDTLTLRGQRYLVVRDNVVLELGVFASRLGRERTFIILQKTDEAIHLPSDLQGITPATFEWPLGQALESDFRRLNAAIGPAALDVRVAMSQRGTSEDVLTPLSGGMIFLALCLRARSHSLHELAGPFQGFQKETGRLGPGSSGYAAKAAKYACQCLEAVGIVKHFGGDEYSLTSLGRDLLDSDKVRHRFANSYRTFEQLNGK